MLNENRFLGTFRGHNTRTTMDGINLRITQYTLTSPIFAS
jgi:hypothetical protein